MFFILHLQPLELVVLMKLWCYLMLRLSQPPFLVVLQISVNLIILVWLVMHYQLYQLLHHWITGGRRSLRLVLIQSILCIGWYAFSKQQDCPLRSTANSRLKWSIVLSSLVLALPTLLEDIDDWFFFSENSSRPATHGTDIINGEDLQKVEPFLGNRGSTTAIRLLNS